MKLEFGYEQDLTSIWQSDAEELEHGELKQG